MMFWPWAVFSQPVYLDPTQPIERRIDDLLPRLTLVEKISLVHADSKFSTAGVPRLGIPKLWLSDGPHGVREEIGPDTWDPAGRTDDFATWLPVSMALASTWNVELAEAYGGVIAAEARQRGKVIMLGPGVNMLRTPLNGRTFEYLGEDPWLASRLAVADIRGIQAGQVAACVKHFAVNNQETDRMSINTEVDERTLREIYLPAFEAAVKEAGVLSVMGAYNRFRGQFCCHNDYLLNRVLKGEWGFAGLVVSDWDGVHDTREAVFNGLDLEMGTSNRAYDEFYLARPFREGIERGEFPVALLDDKVRRNLRVLFATGAVDGRKPGAINTPAHQAVARRVADEAIVLLKNENGTLPLDLTRIRRIAVIGENATRLQARGGWSSEIKAFYEVSPLQGLLARVGARADVTFSQGYQTPQRRRRGGADGAGVVAMESAAAAEAREAEALIERAVEAARSADVAIIVGGLNHDTHQDTEGSDRLGLELPYGQADLIGRVTAANPRTIVVLAAGSPVAMDPWLATTPAVVQAWYAGMEGGHAIAGVLFGDVNPSGKLPCTFPRRLVDSPAHASGAARQFPGENGTVHYDEGVLIGYRWFDSKGIEPLFPFGHGLSYTHYAYSELRISGSAGKPTALEVECTVTNAGARAGSETVQVYVHDRAAAVPRPEQELRGFAKVRLAPGESQVVRIPLSPRALAYYDAVGGRWLAEAGDFEIRVGASSRDIRLRGEYRLEDTALLP